MYIKIFSTLFQTSSKVCLNNLDLICMHITDVQSVVMKTGIRNLVFLLSLVCSAPPFPPRSIAHYTDHSTLADTH